MEFQFDPNNILLNHKTEIFVQRVIDKARKEIETALKEINLNNQTNWQLEKIEILRGNFHKIKYAKETFNNALNYIEK